MKNLFFFLSFFFFNYLSRGQLKKIIYQNAMIHVIWDFLCVVFDII